MGEGRNISLVQSVCGQIPLLSCDTSPDITLLSELLMSTFQLNLNTHEAK